MTEFSEGDRCRIDIPDTTDVDFEYHGEHGTVENVLKDDADQLTGADVDAYLYSVKLDSGTVIELRGRDLRKPLKD